MRFHADKLVRGFLSGAYQTGGNAKLGNSQEPTYLTFGLFFHFDTFNNVNVVTNGLLLPDVGAGNNAESTIRYLTRIGDMERAAYLREFQHVLKEISENMPWHFDSISGVADLFKMESGQNFRGKDKVLTVECTETIDMRLTAMIDLYRKAVWDAKYMRVLPRSKRRFTCEVVVFEYRKFLKYRGGVTNPSLAPSPMIPTGGSLGEDDKPAPIDFYMLELMDYAKEYTSCIHFILENCEFVMDEFPLADSLTSAGSTESAKVRFKINVGTVREANRYSALGYLLSDNPRQSIITGGVSGNNRMSANVGDVIDDWEPMLKPDSYPDFDAFADAALKGSRDLRAYFQSQRSARTGGRVGSTGGSILDGITSGQFFNFDEGFDTAFNKELYQKGLDYAKKKSGYNKVFDGDGNFKSLGNIANEYGAGLDDPNDILGSLGRKSLGLVYDTETGKINTANVNIDNLQRFGTLLGLNETKGYKKLMGAVYETQSVVRDTEKIVYGDTGKELDNLIADKINTSRHLKNASDDLFKFGGRVLGKVYDTDDRRRDKESGLVNRLGRDFKVLQYDFDKEAEVGKSENIQAQRERDRRRRLERAAGPKIGQVFPPNLDPKKSTGNGSLGNVNDGGINPKEKIDSSVGAVQRRTDGVVATQLDGGPRSKGGGLGGSIYGDTTSKGKGGGLGNVNDTGRGKGKGKLNGERIYDQPRVKSGKIGTPTSDAGQGGTDE